MAVGGDVGIAGDAAHSLDPNPAHRTATEQKAVVQISSQPKKRLVDLGHPFPWLGPGPNRRYVVFLIRLLLRDSVHRRGHAVVSRIISNQP